MKPLPNDNEFIHFLKTCKEMNIHFSLHGKDLKVVMPEMEISPSVVDQIKKYKSKLILLIEEKNPNDEKYNAGAIEPAFNQHQGPLCVLQRAMWYANKFSDDEGLLCYYANTRIQGNLDVQALSLAVNTCLIKHPALKMLFSEDSDGTITQKISGNDNNAFFFVDCRNQNESIQLHKIDEIKRGFNLEKDIKLRTLLLQLSDEEFDFIIAMHHCVTDGWSIDILMEDISDLYGKFVKNKAVSAEEKMPGSPSWLDYVQWLGIQNQSPVWQKARKYWQQRLADAPAVHCIPLDKLRPPAQSFCIERFVRKYPESMFNSIKKLALTEGTSIYVVLLSAISLLISKLSGEQDILIGTSVANRPREEFSRIVGLFTNVVCMRTLCKSDLTYRQLLKQNHQQFLQDMEYQFLPFEEVVSLQNTNDRNLSYSPLVQVLFIMQNNDFHGIQLENMRCTTSHLNSGKSQYDIAISGLEVDSGLDLYWDYSVDIFSEESISSFSNYLENVLSETVKNPDLKLSEYSLMSSVQKNRVIYDYSGLQRHLEYSENETKNSENFIDIFKKIVSLYSERMAITYKNQSLTYEQLDQESNQLSNFLKSQPFYNVKRPIAICMSPSIELFIAILGILKCGTAFVPLDSEYPISRLQDCIDQADVAILLGNNSSQSTIDILIENNISLNGINLDDQILHKFDSISTQLPGIAPNSTAYIIFTSGSTGKPKGVMISHEALGHFCRIQSKFTLAHPGCKVLQMASVSFDAAIYEIVMALTTGAELVVAHKEILKVPAQLNEFVEEHGITHSSVPPVLLSILDLQKWVSVKLIFLGGEKCSLDQLQKWSVGRRLYHAYGPTESTVFVTAAPCTVDMQSAHIGTVIETSYCYVLDRDLQPVPPNVVGELFIGGATLAKGYINNSQQTAASFIQDPFVKDKIIYRTGDLVKWLPNGNIEFIQRRDNQVKIRGYRIELEEIQSLLLKHKKINEALVITDKFESDRRKILAYITTSINFSETEAMNYLGQHLPTYMLPSEVIRIPEFPLTINRKIDVSALPKPDRKKFMYDNSIPKTMTETIITDLWKEELDVVDIEINKNIFSIGANSLAISRIASKINKLFRASIPLSIFIENQTISELAEAIDLHTENNNNQHDSINSPNSYDKNAIEVEITEL